MSDFPMVWTAVVIGLCGWALFWTGYVCLLSFLGMISNSKSDITNEVESKRIIVLITAYNASKDIEGCIAAIKASAFTQSAIRMVVIADHCTDDTIARAASMGVDVYERVDGLRGKSHSLNWFFEEIYPRFIDHCPVVISDATARVDAAALGAVIRPLYDGADVSVGRASVTQGGQNWLHAGTDLALRHRANQNLCRIRFGLNPLIEGRLMAFSPSYLRKFGWRLAMLEQTLDLSEHPTEDWRHGLKLAQNRIQVSYVHSAVVWTPLRASLDANTAQVMRWDKGRLSNARNLGWPALKAALVGRDLKQIVAALDSLQPPQIHILIGSVLLVLIGLVSSISVAWKIGVICIAIFLGYYVLVLRSKRFGGFDYKPLDLIRWTGWRCATVFKRVFGIY